MNKRSILEWNWDISNLQLNSKIDIGFTISLINNNFFEWKFTLEAPKDSPYSGGFFYLKASFPKEYPDKPPEVCFITPCYHLQVNYTFMECIGESLGHICISMLNWWNHDTKMKEVIANIYALFYWDNPYSPYSLERADVFIKNYPLFKKRIKFFIDKYASTRIYKEYSKWDFSCPE